MTRPVIFRIRKSSEDDRPATPESADAMSDERMLLRPLKTQLSSSDARTDRLVRQLHAEIESVRSTLGELAEGHDNLLELDAAAVVGDPDAAATLPPPLLVRAIIRLEHERQMLDEEAREKGSLLRALSDRYQTLETREATVRARLETLEDVIAALHANLEDLRYSRTLADHRPAQIRQPPADDGRSLGD